MDRIETRTQLINFICNNILQRAISRACHNGIVQILGGFNTIPPSSKPGWIISVTSVFGRTWHIAVTSDDHNHIFKVWLVETVPWQYYIGKVDRSKYSIYDGDNPQQAELARKCSDKIKKML